MHGLLGLCLSLMMVPQGCGVVVARALLLRAPCWVLRKLHTLLFLLFGTCSQTFFPLSPPADVSPDVNYEELARCTDDFNGAQCKAVCVEAVSIPLQQPVLISGNCES